MIIRIFAAGMARLSKLINRTLSFRLSLRMMFALATLLMVALLIMFVYSRKAVKEEALMDAEQTLEATVERIDNILLGVEQSAGNIYWKILPHINQPEKVEMYTRKLVEGNPYITDCDITWTTDTTKAMGWLEPQTNTDAITTYSLPIFDGQQQVATMTIDVSLPLISKILLETKPSPNSFCTLLRENGSIVIHPDSSVLNHNILILSKDDDYSMIETAEAMLNGETGYRKVELDGVDYYVFYKPFERANVPGRDSAKLGWSAGVILPEHDIFGDYIRLHYIVFIIAVIGLLLLLMSCYFFIHRQLLPLRQLEKSAQRIAEGCYDEPIPDSRQQDEVGRLQHHFQEMQQSLATRMGEMQQLSATLKERGEELQASYEQAQAADRMKTNFLYNMSDQMMSPISGIYQNVKAIRDHSDNLTEKETNHLVDEIQKRGDKVTALLNQLITESERIMN